jgi:hypothetical protein
MVQKAVFEKNEDYIHFEIKVAQNIDPNSLIDL